MKRKYGFVAVLLGVILVVSMGLTVVYTGEEKAAEKKEMSVVTSFYPMYIAAMNVIGDTDGVSLTNLSEPKTGCLHDYQLTPADMKLLSSADVFIVNGGGIESFLSDVAESYPKLVIINASDGIDLLEEAEEHDHEEEHEHGEEDEHDEEQEHSHGSLNAHAWMSVTDYMQQITNIAEGLEAADKAHKEAYHANAESYCRELEPLSEEINELKKQISGNRIVSFHEAYAYLAKELGLDVTFTLNLDEERQVSAGEVAEVVGLLEQEEMPVVLAEELYGRDMGDAVSRETDAQIVYLNTLVSGEYDKNSYKDGMENNIRLLKEAFAR